MTSPWLPAFSSVAVEKPEQVNWKNEYDQAAREITRLKAELKKKDAHTKDLRSTCSTLARVNEQITQENDTLQANINNLEELVQKLKDREDERLDTIQAVEKKLSQVTAEKEAIEKELEKERKESRARSKNEKNLRESLQKSMASTMSLLASDDSSTPPELRPGGAGRKWSASEKKDWFSGLRVEDFYEREHSPPPKRARYDQSRQSQS